MSAVTAASQKTTIVEMGHAILLLFFYSNYRSDTLGIWKIHNNEHEGKATQTNHSIPSVSLL